MDNKWSNTEEAKQKREKEILKLIRKGTRKTEMAEIMQVTLTTISKWIKAIDPQKVEEAEKEAKLEREKELLRLIGKGMSREKIAEIMEVSPPTINRWVSEIDPLKVEEAKNDAKKEILTQIIELKGEGKTHEQIAKIMGISVSTINKLMKERKQQREKEILELIDDEKTKEEMAEIMGVSDVVMTERVNGAKKTRKNKEKQIKLNYRELKQKLREHTITQDEIDDYREYLDDKYDKVELKEVILMSNMYIKTRRTNEAVTYLNTLIEDENMEYLGKEKLIEARNETERIGRIQKAKQLLRANKTTTEISKTTGLSEIEVIKIRDQIQDNER